MVEVILIVWIFGTILGAIIYGAYLELTTLTPEYGFPVETCKVQEVFEECMRKYGKGNQDGS